MSKFGRRTAGAAKGSSNKDGGGLVQLTGLFENEGKAHWSVKVKEDIVIPAGSLLLCFENDLERAKEKGISNPATFSLAYAKRD